MTLYDYMQTMLSLLIIIINRGSLLIIILKIKSNKKSIYRSPTTKQNNNLIWLLNIGARYRKLKIDVYITHLYDNYQLFEARSS